MSGEVLYRKWRPPRFADIVGQGPITQTLTQAVATGRTAHAYLLCGPRGTGKTSTARVLAKALNCTNRPPGFGDPCGLCDACKAIDQGSYIDLIEIDAASNRGIEEMRDLREKVRFSPIQGKTKVYIIDEAHALTTDAFNAFLKTLEEPPPHSVFVLATTEPHRLPATIVSRCQRFDFHRIAPADVVERLREIAASENVDVSPEVLRTIARASGGSLRDATNLLDQLITAFGANVSMEQVRELLGIGGEERALALVKHLLTGNTAAALELINTVSAEGADLRPLHRMTVDFLRAALLMKSGVKDALELSKEAHSEISFAASGASMEHLLRSLRLFGQITLKFDQPSPLPLELATVELSLEPELRPGRQAAPEPQRAAVPQPPQQPAAVSPQPRPRPQQPSPQPVAAQPTASVVSNGAPSPPVPVFDPSAPAEERLIAQWPSILRALGRVPRRRFDVAALLRSSSKRELEGNELVVHFAHLSNRERLQDELEDPRCRLEIERVLEEALGEGFTLRIDDDASRPTRTMNAQEPGHLVRAAMNLGGQVVPAEYASPPASAPSPVPDVSAESMAKSAEPEPTAPPQDEPSSLSEPTVVPGGLIAPDEYASPPASAPSPVPDVSAESMAKSAEPEPTAPPQDEPSSLSEPTVVPGGLIAPDEYASPPASASSPVPDVSAESIAESTEPESSAPPQDEPGPLAEPAIQESLVEQELP